MKILNDRGCVCNDNEVKAVLDELLNKGVDRGCYQRYDILTLIIGYLFEA